VHTKPNTGMSKRKEPIHETYQDNNKTRIGDDRWVFWLPEDSRGQLVSHGGDGEGFGP